MTDKFDRYVRKIMLENHAWFEGVESPASINDVEKIESKLCCALPNQYRHFALTFGGGYFGRKNISTLQENSDWYLLCRPLIEVCGENMLIISDDEAGGYYGFVRNGDIFESKITYITPDDGQHKETASASFFDFIENYAINI